MEECNIYSATVESVDEQRATVEEWSKDSTAVEKQ